MDKEIVEALSKAKKLKKREPLSRADIVKMHRRTMEDAEDLRGLLKPTWFVLGDKSGKRKVYKPARVKESRR